MSMVSISFANHKDRSRDYGGYRIGLQLLSILVKVIGAHQTNSLSFPHPC